MDQRGRQEGRQEGRLQGRQEGETLTILRLIERKFLAEAKETYRGRVEEASLEKVEQWFDRAIDAGRGEEIFADG